MRLSSKLHHAQFTQPPEEQFPPGFITGYTVARAYVIPRQYLKLKERALVLLPGRIDDFNETYLNGKLIGRTGRLREDRSHEYRGNE